MGLTIGVELANLVAVQRSHDPNARQHRRATALGDQEQCFGRRQPIRRFVLCLRELRDVGRGILKRLS